MPALATKGGKRNSFGHGCSEFYIGISHPVSVHVGRRREYGGDDTDTEGESVSSPEGDQHREEGLGGRPGASYPRASDELGERRAFRGLGLQEKV